MAEEPVLIELWHAPEAFANVLDLSGATGTLAMIDVFPWRSFLITVVLLLGLSWVVPGEIPALLAAGVMMVVALREWTNHRVFVTASEIVRQWGLLRRRRIAIPLQSVERIEVSYPRWGKTWDVGDISVAAGPLSFTFIGVRSPERIAERILEIKAQAAA